MSPPRTTAHPIDDEGPGVKELLGIGDRQRGYYAIQTRTLIERLRGSVLWFYVPPDYRFLAMHAYDFVPSMPGGSWLVICDPNRTKEQMEQALVNQRGAQVNGITVTESEPIIIEPDVLFPARSSWVSAEIEEGQAARLEQQSHAPDRKWVYVREWTVRHARRKKKVGVIFTALPAVDVALSLGQHGLVPSKVIHNAQGHA